jgi:hypothetical protein
MPLSSDPAAAAEDDAGALRGDGLVPARLRALAAVSALLLLSACAAWPPVVPPAPPPPAPAPVPVPPPAPLPPPAPAPAPEPDPAALADAAARRLLAFHDRVRDLPAADLAREIARLEANRPEATAAAAAAAAAAASGAATTPPGPGPGTASAGATLELALLLSQTRHNGDLPRALALLDPLLRPGAPAATQSLARLLQARLLEQRRLEEQLERQAQQQRELQRRVDQLGAQLDALKAIERSLNTRPAAPVPVPLPPR